MNPAVLIYRSDLLPPSETFVAAQAHALRRFCPCFAGLRLVPAGLPLDPSFAEQKKILKALAEQYKRDAIRLTKREETP